MKEVFVLFMFITGLIWWSVFTARALYYWCIVAKVALTPQDKFIADAVKRMRKAQQDAKQDEAV